jgi:hypothetical protein
MELYFFPFFIILLMMMMTWLNGTSFTSWWIWCLWDNFFMSLLFLLSRSLQNQWYIVSLWHLRMCSAMEDEIENLFLWRINCEINNFYDLLQFSWTLVSVTLSETFNFSQIYSHRSHISFTFSLTFSHSPLFHYYYCVSVDERAWVCDWTNWIVWPKMNEIKWK